MIVITKPRGADARHRYMVAQALRHTLRIAPVNIPETLTAMCERLNAGTARMKLQINTAATA